MNKMRAEDYRRRNYKAYREIHKNCVVDTKRVEEMTMVDCVEMYFDVVKHMSLRTTAERCKKIIYMFKERVVVNKWKDTSKEEVKRTCINIFIQYGYCEATIKQMVNIVFSSIRLAEDVMNHSYEKNSEQVETKKEDNKVETKRNVVIIGLREKSPTYGELNVGECFMIMNDEDNVYMKIETKQTRHYYEDNTVCLNNGKCCYTDVRGAIIKVKADIVAEIVKQ